MYTKPLLELVTRVVADMPVKVTSESMSCLKGMRGGRRGSRQRAGKTSVLEPQSFTSDTSIHRSVCNLIGRQP